MPGRVICASHPNPQERLALVESPEEHVSLMANAAAAADVLAGVEEVPFSIAHPNMARGNA